MVGATCVYEIGENAVDAPGPIAVSWLGPSSSVLLLGGCRWPHAGAGARGAKLAAEEVHDAMHAAVFADFPRAKSGVAQEHVAKRRA